MIAPGGSVTEATDSTLSRGREAEHGPGNRGQHELGTALLDPGAAVGPRSDRVRLVGRVDAVDIRVGKRDAFDDPGLAERARVHVGPLAEYRGCRG